LKYVYISLDLPIKQYIAMTIRIVENFSKQELEKQLAKTKKGRKFNTYLHLGKLDWGQDALIYQKELRAE
jgi:hypothetical protein